MTVWATRADQVDLRGPNPHDLARSLLLPSRDGRPAVAAVAAAAPHRRTAGQPAQRGAAALQHHSPANAEHHYAGTRLSQLLQPSPGRRLTAMAVSVALEFPRDQSPAFTAPTCPSVASTTAGRRTRRGSSSTPQMRRRTLRWNAPPATSGRSPCSVTAVASASTGTATFAAL